MSLLNQTRSVFGCGPTLHRVSGLPYAELCHCLAKEDAEWIWLFRTFYSLGPGITLASHLLLSIALGSDSNSESRRWSEKHPH